WSTQGNIDAGRGAKSSLSAPPPTVVIDASGRVTLDLSAAVAGSGIRTIVTGEGVTPGDVDLIAPVGFVNAGDAGIGSAGDLNIAARTVVGLDNIQVGGASTGVPAETSGLGASLSGVSGVAASTQNTSNSAAEDSQSAKEAAAPMAQSALSWLDVFVVGLGEENCKQDDTECLKRQKSKPQ
ncbi:MAG TPA: filamentous hemagglutinin family protein, partial [Steroidobacteraceae bacterium]|nr:filamentous hemagglutinin family protein [Steroidobacteraceae bacterium]